MMYHLTLVRMAIINESTNNKRRRECGEKGTLLHCWQECKQVLLLYRIVWRFLKKLEFSYDPAIPLLGIYPDKTIIKRRSMHPYVHSSTIHNSQDGNNPNAIDRWMDKEGVVHIYNGILLSHKKDEIMPSAATGMQLEIINVILSEVSQKKRNTISYHLYVESKI